MIYMPKYKIICVFFRIQIYLFYVLYKVNTIYETLKHCIINMFISHLHQTHKKYKLDAAAKVG